MHRMSMFFVASLMTGICGALVAADFTFEPPAFPTDAQGQVFHHFLPAHDGFAANVNLQIQLFDRPLADYDEISMAEFDRFGLEVIERQLLEDEVRYEYAGEMNDRQLHWFARALQRDGRIYLVTATCLAERWETEGPVLKTSALSFALPEPPPEAEAEGTAPAEDLPADDSEPTD